MTTNLMQNVFKYREAIPVMAAHKVFQIFNFLLKAQVVSQATKIVSFYCSDFIHFSRK